MSTDKRFQAAYLPIGVPTFHLESARKAFNDSLALLRSLCGDISAPEDILLCDSPSTAAFTLLTTLSLTDGTILDALACDDAGMAVCPGETAVILARPVWSVGSGSRPDTTASGSGRMALPSGSRIPEL